MDYLIVKFLPYLLLALCLGLVVGWFSCRRAED